jgi:large subunit ribosomal protein L2
LSRVSLAELTPGLGIQYVRSAGCFARFIKINAENHTAILQLPSGVRKAFSLFSLASLGAVALRPKRWTANTKSGYWRSYGVKPHVRGVARNPIDHPHGGRTKSIKYPRTPWGKTTKFK